MYAYTPYTLYYHIHVVYFLYTIHIQLGCSAVWLKCNINIIGIWSSIPRKLQSWSKVMVHLAFFENSTVPSPLPPYNVGSVHSKCPPWSNIVWGEGGGPSLGKGAAFIIEQGAIMKTKQIFKVYHILLTRIVDSWDAKMIKPHHAPQPCNTLYAACAHNYCFQNLEIKFNSPSHSVILSSHMIFTVPHWMGSNSYSR